MDQGLGGGVWGDIEREMLQFRKVGYRFQGRFGHVVAFLQFETSEVWAVLDHPSDCLIVEGIIEFGELEALEFRPLCLKELPPCFV